MPKSIRLLLLSLPWLVLCAHNTYASGALYQVEILVFERLHQDQSREQWPKNIDLVYPAGSLELVDPKVLAEREANPLDEFETSAVDDLAAALKTGPKTLQYLPSEARRMNASQQALQRNNAFRVLFHQAWQQQLVDPDRAPPLVIRGGNEYGEHRELEGTVAISLSRYLHIHTDLWLSQFVPNVGQDIEHWPSLPLPPSAVKALYQPLDLESISLELQDQPAEDLREGAFQNYSWQASEERSLGWSGQPSLRLQMRESPYRVQEITTLRQRRRMRSAEVHYLDHPRMGLLIRIDPVR